MYFDYYWKEKVRMKHRRIYSNLCIIFLILLTSTLYDVSGISRFEDKINDVVYYSAGVSQSGGITTYPEIDIYETVVDVRELSIEFRADLIDDAYHYYELLVWWNGKDNNNVTAGYFGRNSYNSVKTYLENASGVTIVDNNVTGIAYISSIYENELIFPVPNYTLISAPTPPGNVKTIARYDKYATNEYYYDEYEYPVTDFFPGYSFVITLIGMSIITIAVYFVRKHKKSGV